MALLQTVKDESNLLSYEGILHLTARGSRETLGSREMYGADSVFRHGGAFRAVLVVLGEAKLVFIARSSV